MDPAEDTKLSLTLLIDTSSQKVLFAEAGKEFVDFLFYLLALPVGTVTRLLTKKCMVGSLGNLYDGIENLNQTYFLRNKDKDFLLRPNAPALIQSHLLLTNEAQAQSTTSSKKFYICSNCHKSISDDPSAICPGRNCLQYNGYGSSSGRNINTEVNYIAPTAENTSSSDEGGFVKGVVTYMVMDDLVVKPMSTISTITLLNKFNVKNVGTLEEKVVDFAMAEGLKLLEASLQSKSVLTSVFLGGEGA